MDHPGRCTSQRRRACARAGIEDDHGELRESGSKRDHSSQEAVAALQQNVRELEGKLAEVRRRRADIARDLGRAEGAMQATNVTVEAIVAVPHVRQFVRESR